MKSAGMFSAAGSTHTEISFACFYQIIPNITCYFFLIFLEALQLERVKDPGLVMSSLHRLSSPDVIHPCLTWEDCLKNTKHIFLSAARASAGCGWGQLPLV